MDIIMGWGVSEEKCLYRNVNGCKACMPNGGINDISNEKVGDVVKMCNGDKYQVVKCKFPECM